MLYKGYVETKDKKCVEKFKDRTDFKTLEQVKNLDEYAGILAEDTIFIDIDNSEQAEKMMDIVETLQLNCRVICTKRGKHFIFKNSQIHNCSTHTNLAIGLTADIKVGFKASYEVLKVAGEERFVEWDIEEGQEYQEIPKMFFPVKCKMDFLEMDAGDGRNQSLFNYILTLQSNNFNVEETRNVIRLINQYVLKDPLSDDEIETILRDDAFKKPVFFNGAQFLFDKFSNYLKNTSHVVVINGNLHIYKDGIYRNGYREIESVMIKHIPNLSSAKRKEVLQYMNLICKDTKDADARYIAFRNGVYDLVNDEMVDFNPDIVVTNKIPWDYNPNAFNELTDNTLNKLSCNDEAIRHLLEECIGYCFYRRNELGKAFILTGDKSNGKSTFLDCVKAILGEENISALDLKELGDRFSTSMMFGKLANIGDDIGDDFLQGSQVAIFKKIVTGNRIKAERKGQDPFEFNPFIKLLFSANDIPRMKDKTGAVLRRLVIIPFNATFSKQDPDYDPFIKYKLISQESIEYMISLGVEGLKRVIENQEFTSSTKVDEQIHEYEEENNPISAFITEHGEDSIVNEPTNEVYLRYKLFCVENSMNPMSNIVFSKQLNKRLNLKVVQKKINGTKRNVFELDE
ncbi:MAG: phage/plasmid primase, P4 family [Lachnotalea sp.]